MVRVGTLLIAVVAVIASACSDSPDSTADHCELVEVAVAAEVLADDLISPDVSAQGLRDRLDSAIAAAGGAAETATADAAAAWTAVSESLRSLRVELAATGFDLVAAASPIAPESDAPVRDTEADVAAATSAIDVYGGDAITAARRRAAEDGRACGLFVDEPGPVVLASGVTAGEEATDPRSADLRTLPADQLAALVGRSFSQSELDGVLERHEVVSVSELARVLIAAPVGDPLADQTLEELRRRVVVDGPGDDASLDALYDACSDEGAVACDLLASLAPAGSEYADFGDTCGDRRTGPGPACGDADLR